MKKNPHAQALGKLGGQAAAANMSPAERRARAAKAGKKAPGWPKGKPRGKRPNLTKTPADVAILKAALDGYIKMLRTGLWVAHPDALAEEQAQAQALRDALEVA